VKPHAVRSVWGLDEIDDLPTWLFVEAAITRSDLHPIELSALLEANPEAAGQVDRPNGPRASLRVGRLVSSAFSTPWTLLLVSVRLALNRVVLMLCSVKRRVQM
jgi:hypothetical protein